MHRFRLVFAAHMGWIDHDQGLVPGRQHAIRAIALDDRDPWGRIALGYWAMMERRTEESIAAFRRAVNLNPNSAAAHSYLSHIFAFAGQDPEAIEHGEDAIRLSPLDVNRPAPDTSIGAEKCAPASKPSATWHYALNRDLGALQRLGGWKSIQMVMRYTHVNVEELAHTIAALPGGDLRERKAVGAESA